jgi:hypothetical protein
VYSALFKKLSEFVPAAAARMNETGDKPTTISEPPGYGDDRGERLSLQDQSCQPCLFVHACAIVAC